MQQRKIKGKMQMKYLNCAGAHKHTEVIYMYDEIIHAQKLRHKYCE